MLCRGQTITNDSGSTTQRIYAIHDANFNVTAIADASGQILERYAYDANGKFTILNPDGTTKSVQTTTAGWNYLHQGGRYDATTGLYNFRNRDYNPETQRWMQHDPLGYVDGANLYQYIRSNPLNQSDPLGTYSFNGSAIQQLIAAIDKGIPLGTAFDASPYGETGKWAFDFGNKMKTRYPKNPGGYDNAGRHGAWQAELTRKYGKRMAEKIGDVHEGVSPDPLDSKIDDFNNDVGRKIGEMARSRADVERLVQEALDRGDFITSPTDPRLNNYVGNAERERQRIAEWAEDFAAYMEE